MLRALEDGADRKSSLPPGVHALALDGLGDMGERAGGIEEECKEASESRRRPRRHRAPAIVAARVSHERKRRRRASNRVGGADRSDEG